MEDNMEEDFQVDLKKKKFKLKEIQKISLKIQDKRKLLKDKVNNI